MGNKLEVLYKIPLVPWVYSTIQKMNISRSIDIQNWERAWLNSYYELGGISENSGSKGCPKHATYGLWRLGLIVNGGIKRNKLGIRRIDNEYGKNAAYAVLALELIERGFDPEDIKEIWSEVRIIYRRILLEEPAKSNQGAVKVASILYNEGKIVPCTVCCGRNSF